MAMKKSVAIAVFTAAVLAGCVSRPVASLPVRSADVYPNARTIAGLTVAVDPIFSPDRVRQYFGADLTKEGILPVNVIYTNYSDVAFLVKPSEVILLEGNDVVDPIPPELAGKLVRGGSRRIEELALREKLIPPGGNHQGILLFRTKEKEQGLYGKVERLLLDRLSMRVTVTEQDSGERFHFGPYSLSRL